MSMMTESTEFPPLVDPILRDASAALSQLGLEVSPGMLLVLGEGLDFHTDSTLVGIAPQTLERALERLGARRTAERGEDRARVGEREVWLSRPSKTIELAAVREAMLSNAIRLDELAGRGLDALNQWLDTLRAPSGWSREELLQAGVTILQQGGGGLYRRLYRDGLLDVQTRFPELQDAQLSISMTRVGDTWQTLGSEMILASRDERIDLSQTYKFALATQTFEETFWERIRTHFSE